MKLRQLQYLVEVARHELNVTAAARTLDTSQPGISKQIRHLEDELGVTIFARSGKRFSHLTPVGAELVRRANELLNDIEDMRRVALEFQSERRGTLSLATTHTQARYALPPVIEEFRAAYPEVALHINQGTPAQIAELVMSGEVDFAIATEGVQHFSSLIMLPCYRWNRCIVVPKGHALEQNGSLTLSDIAAEPLVTYVFGFARDSTLQDAFQAEQLEPNVVFTATDTDVIKTYVRLGLGIGIIASMAYDPDADSDLVAIDTSHLFEHSTTHIGFRKGTFLRQFMLDFIQLFAPHLTRDRVVSASQAGTSRQIQDLFEDVSLPSR